MDFNLTANQQALKKELKAFIESEVDYDLLKEYEHNSEFPRELYQRIGKRGWTGAIIPTRYGGMGLGAVEMAIIFEEFGTIGISALALTQHAEKMLLSFGTEEQREMYLPLLAKGDCVSAIVISESKIGSSFKNMETTAQKKGSKYVLNGHKVHINLGKEANLLLVFALAEKGLTVFLVDGQTPGIRFIERNPIGFRLEPISDIYFENCEIDETCLLGEEGRGLKVFFSSFNLSRIGNASHLLGIARSAMNSSIKFALNRRVGDSLTTDFQGIRWIIAELSTKFEAASIVRFKAAFMEDAGMEHAKETAMAKLLAIEVAEAATNRAFSIVGGYGCYTEAPFERYLRDAKVGQLAGGSMEIMKNIISNKILEEYEL